MSRKKAQVSSSKTKSEQISLSMKEIEPMTHAQNQTFDAWYDGYNMILMGSAGTGKSFISTYLGLEAVFDPQSPYHKVLICRSCVPSRDIGYLPGSEEEKIAVYKRPYQSIVNELFKRGDAWEILEKKGLVEFCSTSFLRGTTIDNTIIFVDEIQNLSSVELHTVVTRIGKNTGLVLAGDFMQTDLDDRESGLREFYEIAKRVSGFKIVSFQEKDIVRNDFIKDYIIAMNAYHKERKERQIYSGHKIERTSVNGALINGREYQIEEASVN